MSVLDGDTTSSPPPPPSRTSPPHPPVIPAGTPPSTPPDEPVHPRFGRVGIVPWSFGQTWRGVAATLIPWVAFLLISANAAPQTTVSSGTLSPLEDAIGAVVFVIFTAIVEGAFLLAPGYYAVVRRAGATVREGLWALGFRRTPLLPAIGWVVGGLIVVYAASVVYQDIITRFSLGLHTNVDTLQQLGQHAPLTVIGTLIGAVFIAPFCEEIFFRGFTFAGFLRGMPVWAAVLLSALLFGIAHGDIGSFALLFVIGVVLAVVRWRTGSIWPGMALHMANNAVAALVVVASLGH
ncbi:MAG TPA: CPBP family intramembrane glutamic endopeptidase [Ktedonobacterales bacterium]|nr:CPBP family intramembrane glutamic endopeptidase [Ktedonobacterales bacterium]